MGTEKAVKITWTPSATFDVSDQISFSRRMRQDHFHY